MWPSCSKRHQSLLVRPPSTWWAAVAAPQRNPFGNCRSAITGSRSGGQRRGRNPWRGDVLPARGCAVLVLEAQGPGALDRLAHQLPIGLGAPVEDHPGSLNGIGVADESRGLAREPPREVVRDVQDPPPELPDRLVPFEPAPPRLVHP